MAVVLSASGRIPKRPPSSKGSLSQLVSSFTWLMIYGHSHPLTFQKSCFSFWRHSLAPRFCDERCPSRHHLCAKRKQLLSRRRYHTFYGVQFEQYRRQLHHSVGSMAPI